MRPQTFRFLAITLSIWAAQALAQAPVLRPGGPDAEALGQSKGWPLCAEWPRRSDCRVALWSIRDNPFSRQSKVPASDQPRPLAWSASPPQIRWRWQNLDRSLEEFLDMTRTTGLLILKDGKIVAEYYQYGRSPDSLFRSFSMAKTVTGMLTGIAHAKGVIASLDDPAGRYWPEIAHSEYGRTTIRQLLRMSSGVAYSERYDGKDDHSKFTQVLGAPQNRGQAQRVTDFVNSRKERSFEAGSQFHYATIETEILGRVLIRASGRTLAELTRDWIWKPMGANDEARWILSSTDEAEAAGGGFSASLRDWALFGWLLANDGAVGEEQIIPREFVREATDATRQPEAFRPGKASSFLGYGYQTWIMPGERRVFMLQGVHGQSIIVHPEERIVMVQTSVNEQPSARTDRLPYQLRNAFWNGVLRSLSP